MASLRTGRVRLGLGALVVGLVATGLGAPDAGAVFPGTNGRIAYVISEEGGGQAIYAVDPDGSDRQKLTNAGFASSPAWSPDSERIAFSANSRIWVMNADGSGAVQVSPASTPAGEIHDHPAWSPDGSQIAFTSSIENESRR
jgi:TolB protein